MDELYTISLEFIRWLHSNYPQLTGFMTAVSFFGSENFYLVIMPLIYWSINKRLGRYVGYLFVASLLVNTQLKHIFRGPRPFWLDPAIITSGTAEQGVEHQYGIPSGHTQTTTILLLFLASRFKKGWGWAAAIVAILLMMLSRLYLGLHFLQDLAGGLLVAFVILFIYWLWLREGQVRIGKYIFGRRLLWAIAPPFILLALYAIIIFVLGEPETAVSWSEFIPGAEMESYKSVALSFGAFLGFAIGILFEARDVRFQVEGAWWQRLLRFIVGLAGMLLCWRGLALIFPTEPTWLMLIFRALRYFITVLWVTYFAPMLFVRIGLAEADPKHEISIKSWER
jgi:membrane-associated phospholipid phosphatase